MKIEFEVELEPNEIVLLKSILNSDDEHLNVALNRVSRSAFEEYRKMILGQKVFTRGRDIQEFRLFIFIKYFFNGKIPDEQRICDLFQVTATESRSLIRSIMSKYQYELRDTIQESLKEQVEKIIPDLNGEGYKLSIQNQYFKDELNRMLGTVDASLPMIEKERGTISIYSIKTSSYLKLCELYSITPKLID